jgi:hypothetical protein
VGGVAGLEQLVNLTGDAALQAADGLASGEALDGAAVQVVAGALLATGTVQGALTAESLLGLRPGGAAAPPVTARDPHPDDRNGMGAAAGAQGVVRSVR